MISALVWVPVPRLGPAVATLEALVAGVAAGVVADAVLLMARADPDFARLGEGVGAAILEVPGDSDPWSIGVSLARRDWLLCLEAGDVPVDGWIRALERFVGFGSGPRLGRLDRSGPIAARLGRRLDTMAGTRRLRAGDLVHRSLVANGTLTRRLRPTRIRAALQRDEY